jgi:lysophospholipase L1-like esterase
MFMAYGASLAEQFEVIQGWLAGGNSSRSYSGASCPFLGVPEAGRKRDFRVLEGGQKTVHMAVDGSDDLGTEPEPLVKLQWGLYAFAPSRTAQTLLAKRARAAVAVAALPWSAERGHALIKKLRGIEKIEGPAAGAVAWKAALEDPDALARFDSASIWAAVRALHGGVLRMPYGILVAAPELVDAVLKDETRYTVDGYRRRLVAAGMGPIYLGRDASDPEYARQSAVCNSAIESISMQEAYRDARVAAKDLLSHWIEHAISVAEATGEPTWELSLDSRDLIAGTLATLGEGWFGLDDSTTDGAGRAFFQRGAMDWQWRPGDPVYYPGHFTAASRATFQAEPSDEVTDLAAEHGTALTAALRKLIETKGVPAFASAHVSQAVLGSLWSTQPDVAVQNIAGALMGLLPTTEGILRRVLPEWTRAGTLLELAGRASGLNLDDWSIASSLLGEPLRRAIKFKPVPEQVWREAKVAHSLGSLEGRGEQVQPGEKLIIGQVSALHAQLERGDTEDVYAAFGGRRGSGQPTHACPGYHAAIGAMMGLVSATLARSEGQLATSTAPGVLVYRGRTPNPEGIVTSNRAKVAALWNLAGERKRLLAFGDSWIRFQDEDQATGGDFRRALAALGYDTDEFDNTNYAYRGRTLAEMAEYKPSDGKYVYARLRELIKVGAPPLAVLVSGGGNDFVDGTHTFPKLNCAKYAGLNSKLEAILKNQSESPQYSEQALKHFLTDMKTHLAAIVSNLAAAGTGANGKQLVPIIVVAYDHPIPDGRAWQPAFTCPWLRPVFARKKYDAPNGVAQSDSSILMATFITRLNEAYGEVATTLASEGILVRHVPLTGVLAKHQSDNGLNYKAVWKNELHPTRAGFDVLARHLDETALKPLLVPIN